MAPPLLGFPNEFLDVDIDKSFAVYVCEPEPGKHMFVWWSPNYLQWHVQVLTAAYLRGIDNNLVKAWGDIGLANSTRIDSLLQVRGVMKELCDDAR
jgi:hypothetical protein